MKVWLDDLRPMPAGYDVHARTAAEGIALLTADCVTLISLDHDLGDEANGAGYEVARWIEEAAFRWCQVKPQVYRLFSGASIPRTPWDSVG